jgi:hypothetical protein
MGHPFRKLTLVKLFGFRAAPGNLRPVGLRPTPTRSLVAALADVSDGVVEMWQRGLGFRRVLEFH